MKQYVIDELRPWDHEKIKAYMDKHFGGEGLEGIYWIPIDADQLDDIQAAHTECQPFFFAVELTSSQMACELLVRTRNRVRCNCIRYATESQRNWIISLVDAVFEQLKIIT